MTCTDEARSVAITGAAGAIGSTLRRGLRGRFTALRLSDVRPMTVEVEGEEIIRAELADLDAVREAVRGTDAVVHLGGIPTEAEWPSILAVNVAGTVNLFEAARLEGVRRVVFASSNHVVGYHRRSHPADASTFFRPDSRYGVSKLFGEGVGRLYADKYGLSVVCLRIGSFQPKPIDARMLSTWISPRDTVHLVERALLAPDIHFDILYGVSANTRAFWRNPRAKHFGYAPRDNAEDYAGAVLELPEAEIDRQFHGGSFCSMEFSGEPSRIE